MVRDILIYHFYEKIRLFIAALVLASAVVAISIERHWNADKERFTCNAISYSENSKALEEFKSTYTKLLLEYPELTARQVASYFQPIKQVGIISPQKATEEAVDASEFNFIEKYLEEIIVREKAKQGCNFETYSKLLSKCRKIIKGFSS